MKLFRLFFLLVAVAFALPAFSQTDPNVIQVDSAMKNPDLRRGSKANRRRDTTATIRAEQNGVVKDSARLALEAMPRKAALRSAMVPGWGQLTNRRWWKVPFVYGGIVGVGLAIEFNQRYYNMFLSELQLRINEPDNTADRNPLFLNYDNQALNTYKDFYRRNRDLSILLGAAVYAVNIIDAYVDAKLFRFDISNELSFKVGPSLQSYPSHAYLSPAPALKIKITL